jgi:hypothetical protein
VVAAVLPPTYLLMPFAVQALLYPTLGMVSVGAIGWGIYLHRPSRPAPWVLVAGGILLWVLGDIAYAAYELLRGAAPFPSLADALYLSGYLVVAGGLGLSVRRSGVGTPSPGRTPGSAWWAPHCCPGRGCSSPTSR